MKRSAIWLFALIISFALIPAMSIVLPVPANAQGGVCASYDFTASSGGWTAYVYGGHNVATYVASSGWTDNYPAEADDSITFISPDFGTHTITQVSVTFSATWGGDAPYVSVWDSTSSTLHGSSTQSGVSTINVTVDDWTTNQLLINADRSLGNPSGPQDIDFYITSVVIHCSDGGATNTPTFTLTPTATPTIPAPPIPVPGTGACVLLGVDGSTFMNLPGSWQLQAGETLIPQNPPGATTGLSLSEGSATLSLKLDPASQYKVQTTFHTTSAVADDSFTISLGDTTHNVAVDETTNTQSFTGAVQNYTGGSDGFYDLVVAKTLHSPDPGLIVDFVCVSLMTSAGATVGATALVVQCANCIYTPVGDLFQDVPKVLDWLWCNLRNLWECVIIPLLWGVWQSVLNIIRSIAFIWLWFRKVLEAVIQWGLDNLLILGQWLGGNINNIITWLLNMGREVLNNLGLTEIINHVLAFFSGQTTSPATQETAAVVTTDTFGQAITYIQQLISAIPEMIASTIDGFNNTSTIPAYAPTCNDSESLFWYPCLGMYIADNTVFEGPAYYLIPIVMGFSGFNTVLWAMHEIIEALDKT